MNNRIFQSSHVKLTKLTTITGQLADCLKHLHTMSKYISQKTQIKKIPKVMKQQHVLNRTQKKIKERRPKKIKKQLVRNRTCCVKEDNLDREQNGYFVKIFQEVKLHDEVEFFNHTRMNQATYDFLLSIMDQSQLLTKHSIRAPFSPEFRLAITIHFLAQNLNSKRIAEIYKIGKETVRGIIKETCESLWQTLSPIYVAEPQVNEFKQISSNFYKKWNIPNCIGALDGRYIEIKCPTTKRGTKFDYRNEHTMVLMAACNAKYEFTFVDVATHEKGSVGVSDFFDAINFSNRIINKQAELLPDKPLPRGITFLPHYFVADSEFFINSENIVKPYSGTSLPRPESCFNRSILPAVGSIDNAFGILAARWPVLQNCFNLIPETAEKIVLACVALHNFILHSSNNVPEYCPLEFADWHDKSMHYHSGEWRQMVPVTAFKPINRELSSSELDVSFLRHELSDYFNRQKILTKKS